MRSSSSWLVRSCRAPRASVRLFCLPYAGAAASAFGRWATELPDWVELCAVQLPGRDNRLVEEPFTRLDALVSELAEELAAYDDVPFAIFGHCMGALIAFELARALRRMGGRAPEWLFVAAFRAPHLPDHEPHVHALPDAEFIARLRQREAVPEAILQDDEAMSLFAPLLRADFAVCETYQYRTADPLTCPISVFGGVSDPTVGHGALNEWRVQTVRSFSSRMLPGGHLFLNSARAELVRLVTDDLRQARSAFEGRGLPGAAGCPPSLQGQAVD